MKRITTIRLLGYQMRISFFKERHLNGRRLADFYIRDTAFHHGLKPEDITGRSRLTEIKKARWETAYRMRHEAGMSLTSIGEHLNRHHSTIIHALRTLEEQKTKSWFL